MKEKHFVVELKNSLKNHGFFFKIPDIPASMTMMRFMPDKPFDVIAVVKGIPIAIEAKMIKDHKSFGAKDLRETQVSGLTEFKNAGGRSFVFLNIRRPADKDKGVKRLNRLLIFEAGWLIDRGQIYKKELIEIDEKFGIEGKKKTFDLDNWVQWMK
jgi:Holliday junction resolvase